MIYPLQNMCTICGKIIVTKEKKTKTETYEGCCSQNPKDYGDRLPVNAERYFSFEQERRRIFD